MQQSNLLLTLKHIQKINAQRLSINLPIMWIDYQIIDLLDQQVQYWNISHYISSQTKCMLVQNQNDIVIEQKYTHIAWTKYQQNVFALMTRRAIGIDQICHFNSSTSCAISITIAILTNEKFLWGVVGVPRSVEEGELELKLVTPDKIMKKGQILQIEVQIPNKTIWKLIFYGSSKQPRYGRKIYDNQLPHDASLIYQINVRFYNSFLQQNINKDNILRDQQLKKYNHLSSKPFLSSSLTKAIKNTHFKSNTNLTTTRRLQEQPVFNNHNSHQYDSQKENILPYRQRQRQRQRNHQKSEKLSENITKIQKNQQAALKQNCLIRHKLNEQIWALLREQIQQKQALLGISTINWMLMILNKAQIDELNEVNCSDRLQMISICRQLQLKIICEVMVVWSPLNFTLDEWIAWAIVFWRQINWIQIEVYEWLDKQLMNYFCVNFQWILKNGDEIFYGQIMQMEQQKIVELVRRCLFVVKASDYNSLTDLLGILVRIGYGENIIELLSKVTILGDILISENINIQIEQEAVRKINRNYFTLQQQPMQELKLPTIYKFNINSIPVPPNILCSKIFNINNSKFRVILSIHQNDMIVQLERLYSQQSFNYFYAQVSINLQSKHSHLHIRNQTKYFKYIFCNGSGYSAGVKFDYNNITDLQIAVGMRQDIIGSSICHYMGVRMGQFLAQFEGINCFKKSRKNFRKSRLILEKFKQENIKQERFKQDKSNGLLQVKQTTIFCIFQNDLIEIESELSVFNFFFQYYQKYKKSNQLYYICFLSMRAKYVPLKYLIQTLNDHSFINNKVFKAIVAEQLFKRANYKIKSQNYNIPYGLSKPRIYFNYLPQQDYLKNVQQFQNIIQNAFYIHQPQK